MLFPVIYPELMGANVIVTGGSGGIGAETCRLFAASGAKVAVNGRDAVAIAAVVDTIRAEGGTAIAAVADCTDADEVALMREQTERELGPVDVLLAFAGGAGNPVPTAQMAVERWRDVIDTNLTSTFLAVKSILPGMIERRRGAIVTIASSAGRVPGPASAAYAAAKAGIAMFSRHVANEVGPYGIRINCIAPATILTERIRHLMPEEQQTHTAATFPLRRMGAPEDVARAALFLASESAAWLTGVTLDVAGGQVML